MNKTEAFMLFGRGSRSVRRLVHDLTKKRAAFLELKGEVNKPKTIVLTNGKRVPYEGP